MAMVSMQKVVRNYYLGKTVVNALGGIDLEVEKGEFICIAGPSGSGKTTLLNLIGCLDKPTSGKVFLDGDDVERLSDNKLSRLRAERIGFIFQSFNLIPVLSAFENIEYPLLLKGVLRGSRKKKVLSMLEEVELADFTRHRPNQLSGGQRQRVAIARALVTDPEMVLADEPTANLDSKTGEAIVDLMRKINQETKATFIFSTHDSMVMKYAHRMIRLQDGRII
ncbi:ABC transporter ATP-binding protein [Candidatus Aerophobetes bacterium]|uniref:ABC transporter ATP-binding protein n=1 Tax=Aerophobetes bacterium TaxID=2030807 RepID=A0A523UZH0_UNCAE|nr:MAG: ABC transporter ATP-binding protein [Candidatus Aerophobetes bacterium]